MIDTDEGFDLETQLAGLAAKMITAAVGEPAIIAHWLLICDVRREHGQSNIGVLSPGGMPDWIRSAMLREVGEEFDFVPFDGEDEDEDDEDV